MGFDKKSWYNWILVILILISLVLLILQNSNTITGKVVSQSAVSNVSITTYFSMSLSGNLSNGIDFGIINGTNLPNINASDNNNSAGGNTSMSVDVNTDSNTAIDVCIGANASLTSGVNFIGINNESYSNSTISNLTTPDVAKQVSLTISGSGVKAGQNIPIGNSSYYRFWLDIPSGQATGTYENNITFKGGATGTAC